MDRHLLIDWVLARGVVDTAIPNLIDLHFSSCTLKRLVSLLLVRDLVNVSRLAGDMLRVPASCDVHRTHDTA